MASVVTPANLGNEFDFGLIEPGKIHILFDGTTVIRDVGTGVVSSIDEVIQGVGSPVAPPGSGQGNAYIDTASGDLYTWDGSAWNIVGGGASPYTYGAGANAIEPTVTSGNSASGDRSVVSGGQNNAITSLGDDGAVVAGTGNDVGGPRSVIVSGSDNEVGVAADSFIGGGNSNLVLSNSSSILGGDSNEINTGIFANIGGGQANTATSDFSNIAGGFNNSVSGTYGAVIGGNTNAVFGESAAAMGERAVADKQHELAHGFGELGGTGFDSQFRRFPGDAGAVGPGSTVDVDFLTPTNSAWGGRFVVVAQDSAFGGSVVAHVDFGARNSAGVVTIDGFSIVNAYGGGTLSPALLLVQVLASGANVRVRITNSALAVTMNCIAMAEVLEVRQ